MCQVMRGQEEKISGSGYEDGQYPFCSRAGSRKFKTGGGGGGGGGGTYNEKLQ